MRRGLLLALAGLAGCTRAHYREAADADAYPVIAERVLSPAFAIGRTRVEPAPGSRLADPTNPDAPPKPPDDPAAAVFMARPGHMKGAKNWERDGVIPWVEPPGWEKCLGLDEKGTLKLTPTKAVEVALLNSREYQTALEAVYRQALALTLNRFEFDVQWFARNRTFYERFGTSAFPTETNTLSVNSEAGFTRNLAAGGQLLANFANSMVYEFTGRTSRVNSNLTLQLLQPLLRGFGRKVRLESLTQAERDTLYAVRDFARFRKSFWAGIAIQGGGYLDLLLRVQQLRNAQENLKQQEETYRLYQELFRGGRASVVELDQFFQAVQSSRSNVIGSEIALQQALDGFKLRLGVPPRLSVELDERLLERFALTDSALEKLRDEIDAFRRERQKELESIPDGATIARRYDELFKLADPLPAAVGRAEKEIERWGERQKKAAKSDTGDGGTKEQREREKGVYDTLSLLVPSLRDDLAKLRATAAKRRDAAARAEREEAWAGLNKDISDVLTLLDAVLAAQTQARIYLIELPDVQITEAEALQYAHFNRLDLQNSLGGVTDAWRKVTVAANALRGDLNVVGTANLGTDPDRRGVFDFSAEATRYTIGVQIDGPLNRRAERNAYRAALIDYQASRRAWMAQSDQIEAQIREDLRQLRQLRVNFDIARQSLLAAARQLENARIILLGPRDRRAANDTTTLNLLQALGNLLGARNGLAQTVIAYEQQRVQLWLDLEALQLDARGFPIDVFQRSLRLEPEPAGDAPDNAAGGADAASEPLPPPRRAGPEAGDQAPDRPAGPPLGAEAGVAGPNAGGRVPGFDPDGRAVPPG